MPRRRFYLLMVILLTSKVTVKMSFCGKTTSDDANHFSIAFIASTNITTDIQTSAIAEALKYVGSAMKEVHINAEVFYLENYTKSLEFSLVKFCDKVVNENITAVVITDTLKPGIFNFIPWISSRLGIPVALMRNVRTYSSSQALWILLNDAYRDEVESTEFNLVYSMKPIIYEQSRVLSELASFYHWTHVTVIIVKSEPPPSHVTELVRRLQMTKPLLTTRIQVIDTTDYSAITDNLHELKISKASMIVLYCSTLDARTIFNTAERLGLLDGERAWIVTESLAEETSVLPWLPNGILAIRMRSSHNASTIKSLFQSLVYDSLIVSAQAQMLMVKTAAGSASHDQMSCYSETRSVNPNADFFGQILSHIQITGKTGPIQFDSCGNRINPEYDVLNLRSNSKGEKEWKRIAYWNKKTLIFNGVPVQWLGGRTGPPIKSLQSKVQRVITALTEPFAFYSSFNRQKIVGGIVVCALGFPCKIHDQLINGSSSASVRCCKGYVIDLLRMLENDLGFKADLHVVKDGKYGGVDRSTGQWNGLIGELMRGEADMAIADLTVTNSRSRVVDFTQPFLHVGMSILVSVKKNRQGWLLRFLDPFSAELWLMLTAAVNVIFLLLWFIDKRSPYGHYRKGKVYKQRKKFHLIASLWFTWGTVFHIDESEARPRSYSSQVITVVFGFGMLVVTNTYTANLAAVLVSEGEENSLTGIQDPKLQNPPSGFTIGTVAETSMEKLFKESQDAVYSKIWRQMKHNSVNTFAEGVEKVMNGELTAFIGDEPTLLYYISKQKSCLLRLAGKTFFQSGFSLALPKNSSLTDKLTKLLILYEELDTSRKLSKRWLSGACENNKQSRRSTSFMEMTFDDVGGAFAIILVGVVISFLVLALEFHVDKFGFPFSHIWTNKPHRHFPSTRQLFKAAIANSESQLFSTAPLELSIGQRRFTESMHSLPWRYANTDYGLQGGITASQDVYCTENIIADAYNQCTTHPSCPASPTTIKNFKSRGSKNSLQEQDSGTSSLSQKQQVSD